MVVFKPSDVHQGHYIYINGVNTGIVVNMFAYETIDDYKKYVDKKIKQFKKK
jgi:hypothetical protein